MGFSAEKASGGASGFLPSKASNAAGRDPALGVRSADENDRSHGRLARPIPSVTPGMVGKVQNPVAEAHSESAGTTVARARALIESRLSELEAERTRLRGALAHLDSTPTVRRAKRASGKRAGRGQRQAEFLDLLRSKPGSSMSELAREMGVQPQQLYAIARRLTASGAITKRDGSYVVVDAKPKADP